MYVNSLWYDRKETTRNEHFFYVLFYLKNVLSMFFVYMVTFSLVSHLSPTYISPNLDTG